MPTEQTHLKNVTPAGNSNSTDETVVIGNGNTYQHPFFVVAGSLLVTFLVLIAVADKSSVQHLTSSAYETDASLQGAVDIFGIKESQSCPGTPASLCQPVFCHGDKKGSCYVKCCNGGPNCCMCEAYCKKYCVKSNGMNMNCGGCPTEGCICTGTCGYAGKCHTKPCTPVTGNPCNSDCSSYSFQN